VVTNRQQELNDLNNLQVGVLPGGSTITYYLRSALSASLLSDQVYSAWAAARVGCTGAVSSTVAAAEPVNYPAKQWKGLVQDTWGPIATSYSLTHWTVTGDISGL
jgi:hypothetical protein